MCLPVHGAGWAIVITGPSILIEPPGAILRDGERFARLQSCQPTQNQHQAARPAAGDRPLPPDNGPLVALIWGQNHASLLARRSATELRLRENDETPTAEPEYD